jgi:hypothetical protein
MKKLPSFKYKNMIFHNTVNNLFQTDEFGGKLVYELKGEKYYLVKDERISSVISKEECLSNNPQSYCNDDNNWK